jgi:L-fuconolactonase
MNATLRVDAHHHVWDLTVRDQPWTAELPPLRRSFGFAELCPAL